MVLWWRWIALTGFALGSFFACSGKSDRPSKKPHLTAGRSAVASGGRTPEGGEGGLGAEGGGEDGGRAGTQAGGRGGSSAASTGATGAGAVGGVGAGGSGGLGVRGGSAGLPGMGGSAGTAHASGGSAGTVAAGWTCLVERYGDGVWCDCGCGALDPDCADDELASCDVCSQNGSCANGACPSNVVPDDNTRCEWPDRWACGSRYYGDGVCDCGCTALDDLDCESELGEACRRCPIQGCGRDNCGTIDPDDNTLCTAPPFSWTCNDRLYRDGSQCDCGCGFSDPDCGDAGIDACETCNAEGSCSGQACPGLIDPAAIQACTHPTPPSGWLCAHESYADGQSCDCGCGVLDPDCRTDTPGSCNNCLCDPENCAGTVDPEDTSRCVAAPPGWTCEDDDYADGTCDCGCGVIDIDCRENQPGYCEQCAGCSGGNCELIDPLDIAGCDFNLPDGWTCEAVVYDDDVCDCGCGARDADCASGQKSACDICNAPGSCSSQACSDAASTIQANDNASCSG